MRVKGWFAAVLVVIAMAAVACGSPPPPPEPPPVVETPPQPDPDSLAAAQAAAREAAAAELCKQAEAALAAGNYERARSLYSQAKAEYPGTTCANSADQMMARIAAIQTIRERIHFDFDRSNIRNDAAAVLQRKAEVLRNYPNVKITIEGHCDERGSLEYNLALGQRRADAAVRYLVNLGLAKEMFRTVSFGEERPMAQGQNEGAWQQNRRDEFIIENMGAL